MLTDGVEHYRAVEYTPTPQLGPAAALAGAKLRLAPVEARDGFLLLGEARVAVLGGRASDRPRIWF